MVFIIVTVLMTQRHGYFVLLPLGKPGYRAVTRVSLVERR
jgi:hypothetical protein